MRDTTEYDVNQALESEKGSTSKLVAYEVSWEIELSSSGITTRADMQKTIEALREKASIEEGYDKLRRLGKIMCIVVKKHFLPLVKAKEIFEKEVKRLIKDPEKYTIGLTEHLNKKDYFQIVSELSTGWNKIEQQWLKSRYRTIRIIGHGGNGCVFLSKDTLINRDVAIKFLMPVIEETQGVQKVDELVARFLQEGQILASLKSPHIVQVYDTIYSSVEGSHLYAIVLEYIPDGMTLHDILEKQGKMNADEAFQVLYQVALGLSEVHNQGIIHRDMKPGNILIMRNADNTLHAKITDFGIAKILSHDSKKQMPIFTQSGIILGTLHYLSPEQAETKPLGKQTDIFSLGVIGYRMLTGRLPFQGENQVSIMHDIVYKDPVPIRSICPTLSKEAAAIIEKAMAKDKADRYKNAAEMAADINSKYLIGGTNEDFYVMASYRKPLWKRIFKIA